MTLLLLLRTEDVTPPIVVDVDTHDGDRKRKRRYAAEAEARESRRRELMEVYEVLVEGKSPVLETLKAPLEALAMPSLEPVSATQPSIDFDRLLDRADMVQKLWDAFIELDDEAILVMM